MKRTRITGALWVVIEVIPIYLLYDLTTSALINSQAAEFGAKARNACEGVVSGDEETMARVLDFIAAVERAA